MKNQIVISNLPNLESFMHWFFLFYLEDLWYIYFFIYLLLKWTFEDQDATIADNFKRKWAIKIKMLVQSSVALFKLMGSTCMKFKHD